MPFKLTRENCASKTDSRRQSHSVSAFSVALLPFQLFRDVTSRQHFRLSLFGQSSGSHRGKNPLLYKIFYSRHKYIYVVQAWVNESDLNWCIEN